MSSSCDPLEDVEDADVVDGDEGGEVGRHVDPLQSASCRIEGLEGFAFLHVPPLDVTPSRDQKGVVWGEVQVGHPASME